LGALEPVCGALSSAAAVQAAFADQTWRREQEERRSALKDRCSEHRSAGALAAERAAALEGDLQRWQWAHSLADELVRACDWPLKQADELEGESRRLGVCHRPSRSCVVSAPSRRTSRPCAKDMTKKRWLEQEAILLDPRLPSALARPELGTSGSE